MTGGRKLLPERILPAWNFNVVNNQGLTPEAIVAGYTAGEQYDCLPGLGIAPVLDTSGDAFYFPRNDDPEITAAQLRMASMMMSKEVLHEVLQRSRRAPISA